MKILSKLFIFICLMGLISCTNDANKYVLEESVGNSSDISSKIVPSNTLQPLQTSNEDLKDVKVINTSEIVSLLSNGMTLQEAGECLNMTKEKVISKYGGDPNTDLRWDGLSFQRYNNNELGLNFISCFNVNKPNPVFSFIECDKNKIQLMGVQNPMNFDQIQSILGKTKIITINNGLPGCESYELRYIINGIKIKFFSWMPDGSYSFNLNIVENFDSKDEYICISHKTIDSYFCMNEEQLQKKLGTPNEESGYDYPENYATFYMNRDGMIEIWLDSRYEIDGVRFGMTIDQMKKILGKPDEVNSHENKEESRIVTRLIYKYNNFFLIYEMDDYGIGERFIYSIDK